uniref:hypothetical protein n=1 Tax=Amycolatopsis sp. CA-151526 TaxID=3239921 RepID=UPI003F495A40
MATEQLPSDCTKRGLAEVIALRARVLARQNGNPVTRLNVEEVASELRHAPRYRDLAFPALRTVLSEVRRQASAAGEPVELDVDPNLGR